MVSIETLRMRLPTGYEHRAAGIARAVGEMLAESGEGDSGSIERLSLDPIKINTHSTDRQIAEAVARQILASLRSM